MKTKEEILKMSRSELIDLKWSSYCSYCSNCSDCLNCLDCSGCSNCSDCLNCSYCSYCLNCLNCSYCINLRKGAHQYKICNIQFTKEEYEKKMKSLEKEE